MHHPEAMRVIQRLQNTVNVIPTIVETHRSKQLPPRPIPGDRLSNHRGDSDFAVDHNVNQLQDIVVALHLTQDLQLPPNPISVDRLQQFDRAKINSVADSQENVRITSVTNPFGQFIPRNVPERRIPAPEKPVTRTQIKVRIRVHARDVRVIGIETVPNTSVRNVKRVSRSRHWVTMKID
jgi:hypothetical protein